MLPLILGLLLMSGVGVSADDSSEEALNSDMDIQKILSKYGIANMEDTKSLSIAERTQISQELKQYADAEMAEAEDELMPVRKTPTVMGYTTVTLGNDAYFYTADAGLEDQGSSYYPVGIWEGDYNTSTRKAESTVVLGPVGYGNAWAVGGVGKLFYVTGEGSQSANIRFTGDYLGLLSAVGGGSASVLLELMLYDYDTESKPRTTVLNRSVSAAGWDQYDSNFNQTLPVVLQAGHSYCAYIQVQGSCGIVVEAEAGSDFGDEDYDAGHTRYSSIVIDF